MMTVKVYHIIIVVSSPRVPLPISASRDGHLGSIAKVNLFKCLVSMPPGMKSPDQLQSKLFLPVHPAWGDSRCVEERQDYNQNCHAEIIIMVPMSPDSHKRNFQR